MDETRLESLRRALAAGSSRRGLLSVLGGVTLSGTLPLALGRSDAPAKKARANKKKKKSAKSTPGPQGPPGADGAQGPTGPAGSLTCPNGTLLHEGACIETTARAHLTFANARAACSAEQRRLPTLAELETFRFRAGHDMSGSQEHTSHIWTDDAFNMEILFSGTGSTAIVQQASSVPFRCVGTPT